MASALYPKFLIAILSGDIDLSAVAVKAIGLDSSYTYNPSHQYYSDLTGITATESNALTDKTIGVVGTGTFDAANATITAATGNQMVAIALFVDRGGLPSADELIAYIELDSPLTLNGSDVELQWDTDGIFSLA